MHQCDDLVLTELQVASVLQVRTCRQGAFVLLLNRLVPSVRVNTALVLTAGDDDD